MIAITLTDAVLSLRPNAQWVLRGDELEWLDTEQSQPSTAELAAELTRLQNDYIVKQYRRDRAAAYPSIGDQLDDLFRQGAFSPEMAATLQAVKTAHPKGTS